MGRIELELDDKGDIVGATPAEIDAIFKRIESSAHGAGYGKGVSKAAEDAKKQIADAIAAEKARLEAEAPLKQAKYAQMEDDYKSLQTRLIDTERASSNTLKEREEAHARERIDWADRTKKFGSRIQDLTKAQLRGEARAHGARDESLDELEVILHSAIGYDDDMNPYVRNGDGTVRNVQGKPMSIAAFVKEYLDGHTHHRRPAGGQGGGARGGASFHGHTHTVVNADAARARVDAGDRSASAINELFEATRARRSA
jgi:hypothetical protein